MVEEHDPKDSPGVRRAILDRFLADRGQGKLLTIAEYQALFPGHEELVLEEFARLAEDPSEGEAGESVMLDGGPEGISSQDRVERLARHTPQEPRYQLRGEVARGGMGAVLKVWDEDLRRNLAMKVILGEGEELPTGETPDVPPDVLARFLEEAQITGQLDHPGIVPVHELGLDSQGRVYFTMRLVKGRDLKTIYQLVRDGREGWNQTRALNVILRACEALAYAHSKGVIHRDLKPANIMVGKFGEVYVMDWGIAKVLDHGDARDLRIKPEATTALQTDRREEVSQTPDSPIMTMDGMVIGTPAYMPPEQAEGKVEEIGPHSDVYALGAMLYELLTGQMPYVPEGVRITPHGVVAALLQGPPRPIDELNPRIPAELVAICEKAMARRTQERYSDTEEMADDLRAYLEHRVVRAYETGGWAEVRKWIVRNKALAVASLTAAIAIVSGLAVSLVFFGKARVSEDRARQNLRDVLDLSTIQVLDDLKERADVHLWPAHPDKVPAMQAWLVEARGMPVLSRKLRGKLSELRAQALPGLDSAASEREDWEFAHDGEMTSVEKRWRHDLLARLVSDLEAFVNGPELPDGVDGIYGTSLPEVQRRLALATSIEQRSALGPEVARRWKEAVADIARRDGLYHGLEFDPIVGLVPLDRNPRTGLWEFWHLASGEPPERNPDWTADQPPLPAKVEHPNRWTITEMTGLVFVLIPGGTFRMGAQKTDENGPNYDPGAREREVPVREVALDPFLLSKYEMTQGQWRRFVGSNPSIYGPGSLGGRVTWASPVEEISWEDCLLVLDRLGLDFPTEAQWEYAARAGTSTPWWVGAQEEWLEHAANLADISFREADGQGEVMTWSDGHPVNAPVGTSRPNRFGLHDVHGNVWEWCRDWKGSYDVDPRPGDALREPVDAFARVYRGGSWDDLATFARSACRLADQPSDRYHNLGVRPLLVIN